MAEMFKRRRKKCWREGDICCSSLSYFDVLSVRLTGRHMLFHSFAKNLWRSSRLNIFCGIIATIGWVWVWPCPPLRNLSLWFIMFWARERSKDYNMLQQPIVLCTVYMLRHDNNNSAVDCPLPAWREHAKIRVTFKKWFCFGDVPDGVNVLRDRWGRSREKTKDDKLEVFHHFPFDLLPHLPGGRFSTPRIHNSCS